MRSSTGGITRSPSVGAVGLSSSPSFPPRSLNSGGVSSSASTSRLPPSHRPMSPEELDSDREQHPALPLQPRKVVGKLSGVGLPERATRKVTGGAAVAGSARAGPSTPSSAASTSAARRMTGTPLKASRKAKGPAGKEDGGKERVVVCVRAKPPIPTACIYDFAPADNLLTLNDLHPTNVKRGGITKGREQEGEFPIDHLHLPPTSTSELYKKLVAPIVTSTVEGFNGTVFAYGMTGSGKTHTMGGIDIDPGVIPRSIDQIFDSIDDDKDRAFFLRVSYLELYNESLRDLLNPNSKLVPTIHERDGKVCVDNLEEVPVRSPEEVQQQLKKGENNRRVGKTDFNEHSSRSHTVFSIIIESRLIADSATSPSMPQSASLGLPSTPSAPSLAQLAAAGPTAKTSGGVVRLSRLNLIDLAGSEKATSDGDRQKEGGFINKSLLDLATVIEKLTDAKPQAHIPYRNSKLTRLLQDSLSGHARIAVICTISLQDQHAYEALATLKFARRVSRIVTRAERGTVVPEDALMEYYRSEIADLRRQLAAANAQARGPAIKTLSDESSDDDCDAASGGPAEDTRQARLRELTAARVQHEEDVQRLQMERTKLQSQISNMAGFILTSEAAPQSPAGPAFGAFKPGKSRRRISDISLGLGRPAGLADSSRRFASAMMAVEEGSASAEARQPLLTILAEPAVPSISVAEHEAAISALRARLDAASAESASRVAVEAQLADALAKVESLSATVSELCSRETAAAEVSADFDKVKAELAERVAALETKVADEEQKRLAVEADIDARARALTDLEADLSATKAAAEEAQQLLVRNTEEAATTLADALAAQRTMNAADTDGLRSQLADLIAAHEAALAAEKSRSTEYQDESAQRAKALEETHQTEVVSQQARLAELEAAVTAAKTKAEEHLASIHSQRSETAAQKARITNLETQLAQAGEAAQRDQEDKEAALAAETASLQARIAELEAKVADVEESVEARTSTLAESHSAALAVSEARIAELESEASVAEEAAKVRQTESAGTHAVALSVSQARIDELEAKALEAEASVIARQAASTELHAAALAASEWRIAELEAKVFATEELVRNQQIETDTAHASVTAALRDQVATLEAQITEAAAVVEKERATAEAAHGLTTAALQTRVDDLERALTEASASAETQRSSLEEAHLAATTAAQACVFNLETKLAAADATLKDERAELEEAHSSDLAALEARLADEHGLAHGRALEVGAVKFAAQAAAHEAELAATQTRLVELEDAAKVSEEVHNSSVADLRARLVMEHEAALVLAQKDGSAALVAQAESHASESAALQSRLAELEDAVKTSAAAAASQQEDLSAAHATALAALQANLDELETTRGENAVALAAAQRALEGSVPRTTHDSEVAALATRLAELEALVADNSASHEQALLDVRSAADAASDAVRTELEDAMRAALVEQATMLQRLHQTELDALIVRNAEMEASAVALDGSMQQALAEIQQALDEAQQALAEADRRHDEAMEVQQQALAAALEAVRTETTAALQETHLSAVGALEADLAELKSTLDDLRAGHQVEIDNLLADHAQALEAADAAHTSQRAESETALTALAVEKAAVESRLAEVTVKLGDQAHLLSSSVEQLEEERRAVQQARTTAAEAMNALATKTAELQAITDEKAQLVAEQAAAAAERAAASSQWMGMTKSPSIAEGLNLAHTGSLRETRRPGHSHNLSYAEPSRLHPVGTPQDEEISKLNKTIKMQRDLIIQLQDTVRIWGEQARKNDLVINELHDEIRSGRVPSVQALSSKWSQSSTHAPQSPWESLHKRSTQAAPAADPTTPSRPAQSSLRHSALAESSQLNRASPRTPVQTPSTPKRHVVNTYVPSAEKPPPLPHASHQHSTSRSARRITIEHDINALKATSKVEQSRSVFDSPVKTPTSKPIRKL